MSVKMLRDFRGKASKEEFYKAGEIVKASSEVEKAMVQEKVAKKIEKAKDEQTK